MGQEARCTVTYNGIRSEGTAHLESEDLRFRGAFRLAIRFGDVRSVAARDGRLEVSFAGGDVTFDLGPSAEKWAAKILHPPALLDKLGVKPGDTVCALGVADGVFLAQLDERGVQVTTGEGQAACDLIFYGAETLEDLDGLAGLEPSLKRHGAVWAITPKGRQGIKDTAIFAAARRAGLVDVKIARFSETHTATKLVIPVARR